MWALHLLSKNPEAQETLHQEVSEHIAADDILSAEEVKCMPYLKAVVKETLR